MNLIRFEPYSCCSLLEHFASIRHGHGEIHGRPAARATLLADGRVLVTGGGIPSVPLSEIYDPATDRWQISANLLVARRGHTATLLPDGRVLVAGGQFCCPDSTEFANGTAEIFDPATGSFALTGTLQQARAFHRATLLADGRVLLSGGYVTPPSQATARTAASASSEIFDPARGKFSKRIRCR